MLNTAMDSKMDDVGITYHCSRILPHSTLGRGAFSYYGRRSLTTLALYWPALTDSSTSEKCTCIQDEGQCSQS